MNFETFRELGDDATEWIHKMIYYIDCFLKFALSYTWSLTGENRHNKFNFYIFLAFQKINTAGTSNADVPLAEPECTNWTSH